MRCDVSLYYRSIAQNKGDRGVGRATDLYLASSANRVGYLVIGASYSVLTTRYLGPNNIVLMHMARAVTVSASVLLGILHQTEHDSVNHNCWILYPIQRCPRTYAL